MRSAARFSFLLVVCLACTGCFSATTLVKVKADGSGTIEQTVAVRKAAAAELTQMMGAMTGGQAAGKSPELFGEAEMRAAASKLGPGVTFVSSAPIDAPDRVGRHAVYAFSDVRQLRIDQKPAPPGPMGMAGAAGGPAESVTFGFEKTPAGHAVLRIVFPEADAKAGAVQQTAGAGGQKPTPEQVAMVKKLLDGLRIDMAVEVDGTIVKTNGAYVSGSRVTLLEMDFAQLLTNDALVQQMTQPKSVADAKALLKNVKGFKVNLDRELTIEFRGR